MEKWYIVPDVIEVKALDNYKLYLKFENGEEKIYDMNELINKYKMYARLKDKEYFKRVRTRQGIVEWENKEDIAPEELYHNSRILNDE